MFFEDHTKEWEDILTEEKAYGNAITDPYRRKVTAMLLENQQRDMAGSSRMLSEDAGSSVPANVTGNVGKYDPILISMVRRSMPNLMAYDTCGVQPMSGPSGLIFAKRTKYIAGGALGAEAFYNEADTSVTGTGTHEGTNPGVLNLDQDAGTPDLQPGAYGYGTGMSTAAAELLGTQGNNDFQELGFEIEKITVEAKSRKLKGEYSIELAQDLRSQHGLDAETELANDCAAELLAEINREVMRTMFVTAKPGAQEADLSAQGVFSLDLDSNGRWSSEKFQGLLFQIERDANAIAKQTRRGKGNFVICSSNVASALAMAGKFTHAPQLSTSGLVVDDTGNTFAGVLNGQYRIYIDPFATGDYYVVGYKGATASDAGLFYCPYIPLQMFRARGEDSFNPRIGFQTRYGMIANPFAEGLTKGNGALNANSNVYFRRVAVTDLHGATT